MQALREITIWDGSYANHTYLIDGTNLVAYIKQGETVPFYFKSPIKGFSKSGRKFVEVKPSPFKDLSPVPEANVRYVTGSKGETYKIDLDEHTCTCSGFTFRGTCKHVKELEIA